MTRPKPNGIQRHAARGWARWLVSGASMLFAAGAIAAQSGWSPEKYVEVVVGTAAGSGSDATARIIQRLMQEKRWVETSSTVVNKPGGGGAIALAYLNQHPGSGHHLLVTSPTLLTNHIVGKTSVSFKDLTPLAQIGTEYVMISVREDSPLKSGKGLIAKLREDSGSLSFGLANSLGNHNHIAIAKLAKAAGGDMKRLKIAVFDSSGKAVAALLGGHVDVVASPGSSVHKHRDGGKIRILGVAAEKRLTGKLADVPTWSEQGAKVVSANWRSVVGPKGMSAAQRQFWDGVFSKLVATDEWQKQNASRQTENTYLNSAHTQRLMEEEYEDLTAVLRSLGLAK